MNTSPILSGRSRVRTAFLPFATAAGRTRLASFGTGAHDGERVLEGTAFAPVVGKLPSGELLANHHVLFAEGTLRTKNDVVPLMPTSDKRVFTSKVKVFLHDGDGVGRAVLYGRLCKAVAK